MKTQQGLSGPKITNQSPLHSQVLHGIRKASLRQGAYLGLVDIQDFCLHIPIYTPYLHVLRFAVGHKHCCLTYPLYPE